MSHKHPSAPPEAQEANSENQPNELEAALQKANDEIAAKQDQLLRTMADFQNFRKRTQSEMEQVRLFATERLVTQLLPILDNFERTIQSAEGGAKPEAILEGMKAVDRQMRTVLESHNVAKIAAAGQLFDPELHEAIATEHTDEHPEGTILHELESGYKMADKVIRPSRVKVAKKK